MTVTGAVALADEANRLVGVAPKRALRVSDEAVRAARAAGDRAAESQALRAQGRAYRELSRLEEATDALRRAVRRAESGGAAFAAGEARMSLAFVLLERGRTRQALAQADRAADGLRGVPAAHVLMQRGLLYQHCGRTTEALDCYRRALPVLRRADDTLHEARVLNNRGVLYMQAGRLAEAEVDLTRAAELYTGLGQGLAAADSDWNLGMIAARRGDIPTALQRYDAAEATYQRVGSPEPDSLVHRGELLLSARMHREAREVAARAVAELTAAGNSMVLAEALLLQAQAAMAESESGRVTSDNDMARDAAARATTLFVRQKRPGWAAMARYVGLRAEEDAGRLTPSLRRRALRAARELAAIGWRAQELDARLIAARVAMETGDRATARRELTAAAAARSTGPLELRIRAWYAEALRRLEDDDRPGAQRALRAAMRVLDQHRSMLGATELRVHLAYHGAEVAALALELALAGGSPRQILDCTERWRARALWHPIRPPADAGLASALVDLRQVTGQLETALLGTGDGNAAGGATVGGSAAAQSAVVRGGTVRLQARKATLEDRVRRLARQTAGSQFASLVDPPTVPALAGELGERALVEIVRLGQTLFAVTVRDGTARVHELGDLRQVRRNRELLLFALRRLALGHGTPDSLAAARAAGERAAAALDGALFGPLSEVIGDRPLVLVPPGELQALPWSALPSCHKRPLTVAPSATMWLRASQAPAEPGGVLLAAGPGLDGAAAEIADLAAAYGTGALTGSAATVEAALAGLDGAAVAHIAAHGRIRSDNPLFSALDLADGPLTVYDLERLGRAPRLVLLPACQSGVGQVLAGDEVLGLTSALFALGTRTVVATVIPVPDEATRPMMLALHAALGRGLLPAEALAQARTAADVHDSAALATASGFVCYGAG
jgi:tetratricopeptide (TPR) repeat protein